MLLYILFRRSDPFKQGTGLFLVPCSGVSHLIRDKWMYELVDGFQIMAPIAVVMDTTRTIELYSFSPLRIMSG